MWTCNSVETRHPPPSIPPINYVEACFVNTIMWLQKLKTDQ